MIRQVTFGFLISMMSSCNFNDYYGRRSTVIRRFADYLRICKTEVEDSHWLPI